MGKKTSKQTKNKNKEKVSPIDSALAEAKLTKKRVKSPLKRLVLSIAVLVLIPVSIFVVPRVGLVVYFVADMFISDLSIRHKIKDPILELNNPNIKLEHSFTSSGTFDKRGESSITNHFARLTSISDKDLMEEIKKLAEDNHWQNIEVNHRGLNGSYMAAKKVANDINMSLWVSVSDNGVTIEITFI